MGQITKKRFVGDIGEEIACRYLEKRGWTIIERNYLRPYGEIDIIGGRGEDIAFFEVKTVTREMGDQDNDYRAEDNLHPHKLKRLYKTVMSYLAEKSLVDREFSINALIVSLYPKNREARVKFIENIL